MKKLDIDELDIKSNSEDKHNNKNKEKNSLLSESSKSSIIEIPPSETCTEVIEEFLKIKKCSILQYGIRPSIEKIKFGYCRTCDLNLMNPICLECLYECHKKLEHDIREINEPDNIICGCGERMHKFKTIEKKTKFLLMNAHFLTGVKKVDFQHYILLMKNVCVNSAIEFVDMMEKESN